jgi:hypothetical protein
MTDLGVKEKELYESHAKPSSGSEKRYPSIDVSGKQAELMGAADLSEGDCVKCEVVLRVKRHSKTEENGKTHYSMCLCVEEMGDMEECEKKESKDSKDSYDESTANLITTLGVDEE